jgi:hypothetical protein
LHTTLSQMSPVHGGPSSTVAASASGDHADRAIRALTAAVVLAVAIFAAVVSYSHIYDLGRLHGQAGAAARLLPLSVDGLIAAASLVLLHEARNSRPAPVLARWMLGLGIAATVGANVAYGLPFGALGALVSAWPAIAFTGTAEMLIHLVRSARQPAAATVPATAAPATDSAHNAAAEHLFAADLGAGRIPGIRAIRASLHVGQDRAGRVQAHLRAQVAIACGSGA